jgi:hypothetical protein
MSGPEATKANPHYCGVFIETPPRRQGVPVQSRAASRVCRCPHPAGGNDGPDIPKETKCWQRRPNASSLGSWQVGACPHPPARGTAHQARPTGLRVARTPKRVLGFACARAGIPACRRRLSGLRVDVHSCTRERHDVAELSAASSAFFRRFHFALGVRLSASAAACLGKEARRWSRSGRALGKAACSRLRWPGQPRATTRLRPPRLAAYRRRSAV